MGSKIKIGIVQRNCTGNPEENLTGTIQDIRKAAADGANIICLQELFRSEYFCCTEDYDQFNLAEFIPGQTTERLQKVAADCKIVLIAPVFEKVDAGIYFNSAVVFDADGRNLGTYRKNHIPDDPGFFEKFYFSPGDTGYKVFETRYARIGVLICWDQWYPEAARITSMMGAQVLFYPTAIGWALTQSEEVNTEQFQAWQTMQRSHAIANGVHVVAVNRWGTEGSLRFWGGSFVVNPFGTILYQSPHDKGDVKVVETDLSLSEYYRVHWPFMRDRRIDTYNPLINRYIKS